MRILLDTHIFLWHVTADSRLSISFRDAIEDPANEVYLSAASIWEAVIKHALGKLPLPQPPAEYLPQQRQAHNIAALPIDEGAFGQLAHLPSLHRDPFDRVLIAQTLQHGLQIASVDPAVLAYGMPHLTA
jgi:PIN domain nuclease of toxin-antitoxin system